MMKKHEYSFSFKNTKLKWSNPAFTNLIDEQVDRVENKKPSVIVIDGMHSGGKTTLTGHIGQYIESKYDREFDYENQVGKGMDNFLERLKWCRENGRKIVVYDEAEDFDRKGAMSRFNRLLNKVFAVMRINKMVVIIVLGIVKKLEYEPIEKGLVRCLINVHGRTGNYANIRLYDAGNIFYLMYLMQKYKNSGKAPMMAYSKTATFMRSRILRADSKDETLWDAIDLKDKNRIQDDASLATRGLIDIKTLAKESGYSISSLRTKFRSLKPEVVKIGRKNYYYRSLINRLAD